FNIKNLFFLRFTKKVDSPKYRLSKELHITQQQEPHANRKNEHYCRRWVSIKTIQDLEKSQKNKKTFGIQISSYENSKSEYLVISSAVSDPFKKNINRSVSLGMLLSPRLKSKLKFFKEDTFDKKTVGVTCETCSVQNCKERAAESWQLKKEEQHTEIAETVDKIINSYD
ncbi:MAG: hypothetical protein ACI8QP_001314, partial [Porticoccaceae bacterium]